MRRSHADDQHRRWSSAPLRPSSAWRVVVVEPLPELRLRVKFLDGTRGEVWLRSFLESPRVSGTIFEPLRDPEFFGRLSLSWVP